MVYLGGCRDSEKTFRGFRYDRSLITILSNSSCMKSVLEGLQLRAGRESDRVVFPGSGGNPWKKEPLKR